jgi:hypothetical protein
MENNSNILFIPSGPSPVKFDICLHRLMASGPMHPVSSTPKKCKLARVAGCILDVPELRILFDFPLLRNMSRPTHFILSQIDNLTHCSLRAFEDDVHPAVHLL